MKNNNKQIISKLSRRSMKQNRFRNTFAVIAIILTSILFTVTFTLTMGIVESIERETMRQVGTSAHAGFKNITREQYEKISQNESIKDYSYNIFFGCAENEELQKRSIELRYSEEKNFEWSMLELLEGRFPTKRNEVVLDTLTLDALGIEHKLGEEVNISYRLLDKKYSDTFILSGYYEGDILISASEAYFSKEYVDDILSVKTEEEWLELNSDTNGIGLIQMNAFFNNSMDIEGNVLEVIEQSGYGTDEIDYGINWAYASASIDKLEAFDIMLIITVLFIIAAAGYLMIYNIFYISIVSDIKFFGLLKTIGTTKSQIKALIKKQADLLSLVGITIGIVLGWLLGNAFMPLVIEQFSGDVKAEFTLNPFIFIFGIVFSYITVLLSCKKPGKIAASISPIEAAKYQDNNTRKKSKFKKSSNKTKNQNKKFSYFRMAFKNIGRNKKKTIFVIASMSLGLILMLEIFTIVSNFSSEKYVSNMLGGADLYVSSASMQVKYSAVDTENNIDALNSFIGGDEAFNELGISSSNLCLGETNLGISGEALKRYKKAYEDGIIRGYNEEDTYTKERIDMTLKEEKGIQLSLYGWDFDVLNNVKVRSGSLDKEKYNSGKYIVLLSEDDVDGQKYNVAPIIYEIGDKLTINGTEYEVMAYIDMPYRLSKMIYSYNGMFGVLPKDEAKKSCDSYYLTYGTVYKADNIELLEGKVAQFTESIDVSMVYYSKKVIAQELNSLESMIGIIGGALSLFVSLIAIMNFINSVITGIITRKREFAMLKSIGMEKEQLLRMLYVESISYVFFTYIVVAVVGSIISLICVKPLCDAMTWLNYSFTLMPIIICFPIILVIALIIPYAAYHRNNKESVVELLSEE